MPRDDSPDPDRRRRRPPTRGRRKSGWRLALLIGCGGGLAFALVVAGCAAFILSEYHTNSDPAAVRAAMARVTDVDIPDGLAPSKTATNSRTGLLTAEFKSPAGASFLTVTTRPGQELKHQGTLQDSRDRGRVAGGGSPEKLSATVTIPATVRGRPAEFVIRRYAGFEQVSGYFQGKEYPAFLEAELAYRDFPAGTGEKVVASIRARDGQ
jgi:hypothetical protein